MIQSHIIIIVLEVNAPIDKVKNEKEMKRNPKWNSINLLANSFCFFNRVFGLLESVDCPCVLGGLLANISSFSFRSDGHIQNQRTFLQRFSLLIHRTKILIRHFASVILALHVVCYEIFEMKFSKIRQTVILSKF